MKLLFIALITLFVLSIMIIDAEAQIANGVIVERLDDYSIKISWTGYTTDTRFTIHLDDSGEGEEIAATSTTGSEFTFSPDHPRYNDVVNAERIGLGTTDSGFFQGPFNQPVPKLPSVTAERLPDNSILVSWEGIRTNPDTQTFHFFTKTSLGEEQLDFELSGDVSSVTFHPTHAEFDEINDADSVGVAGFINGAFVDKRFASIPDEIPPPPVTAERLSNNAIKLSWNLPAGGYIVVLDEDGTKSATDINEFINDSLTWPTTSIFYHRINNADGISVVSVTHTADDIENARYVPIPPLNPTVSVTRHSDNSLTVSWDLLPTDGDYTIVVATAGSSGQRVVHTTSSSPFTFASDHANFAHVNNADRIGVQGTAGIPTYRNIPAEIPQPFLTVERLADNTIRVFWDNIDTFRDYTIHITEGGIDKRFLRIEDDTAREQLFAPSDDDYDRINNAERIGISNVVRGVGIVIQFWQPVPDEIPQPAVTAERGDDNRLTVSWDHITTDSDYTILVRSGSSDPVIVQTGAFPSFTFDRLHANFDQVNNADEIGVQGFASGTPGTITYDDIPIPQPLVTTVRLGDDSLLVRWEHIPTDSTYTILVTTGSSAPVSVHTISSPSSSFTFTSTHDDFDDINDADRIGVRGASLSGTPGTITYDDIPLLNPAVTAVRLADNSVELSWKGVGTDIGFHYVLLVKDGSTSEIAEVNSSPYNVAPSDPLFSQIYNADSIGVSGVDHLEDRINEIFTDIPNLTPGTSRLSEGAVTASTVELSWTDALGAVSYKLFRDDSFLLDVTGTTHTDTGLTAERTYTYHVVSVDNRDQLGISPSNVLTVIASDPPSVSAVRESDDSITLSWENIRTDDGYTIIVTTGAFSSRLETTPSSSPLTFSPGHVDYNQISGADRVGVFGTLGGIPGTTTYAEVPPPNPFLTIAHNEIDNVIELAWGHVDPTGGFYNILLVEGSDTSTIITRSVTENPFILIGPSHSLFPRIYNADKIGVAGTDSGGNTVDAVFRDVPNLTPGIPTLSKGEVTTISAVISWTEALGAVSYELFRDGTSIENTTSLTFTDTGLTPEETYSYTITSYDKNSLASLPSGTLRVTILPSPSVTAERLPDNSILVSWENLRVSDKYVVTVFKPGSERTQIAYPLTSPHTIPADHSKIDEINNAERIGVSAFNPDGVEVGGYVYTPLPKIPSVTAIRESDDSITLSWENIRTDTGSYDIRITEDGIDKTLLDVPSTATSYTFDNPSLYFERVGNAQSIGIAGNIGGKLVDERFAPVPPPTLPTVTAVRLDDNSILVTWVNIPTDRDYDLKIIKDGALDTIHTRIDAKSFTILTTHSKFDDVNNADSIGVNGIAGTSSTRPVLTPVPALLLPTVNAERLDDNSILVTWSNIPTDNGYGLKILEDGAADTLHVDILVEHFTIPNTHRHFDRINNAESIGVNGIAGTGSTATHYIPVPAQKLPNVTATRLADNSILVSWEYIRTHELVKSFQVFITKNSLETRLNGAIYFDTNVALFLPGTEFFNQINDADRVGIAGTIGGESVDKTFAPVPPAIIPVTSLTFSYNPSGSTIVSFTPLVEGEYIISYDVDTDEAPIPSVPVDVSSDAVGKSTTATLLTGLGYAGNAVASFGGAEYVREPIQVPPAPPTLRAGAVTATSIHLFWDESRSATGYTIYENGVFLTETRALSYLHSSLTPDSTYTYTITSTDGTNTSALSTVLSVIASPISVTSLTFSYDPSGNTLVSFTPSAAGEYTISYTIDSDEPAVDSVPVTVSALQANKPVTDTLETSFGYTGIVAILFDGTEHASESIAVPPAAPTLVKGVVTDTSIQLTWDAPRSAILYTIFLNDVFLATVTNPTYTHTGLTPETPYSYTAESTYGSNTSVRSEVLRVSTISTPVEPTVTAVRQADNSILVSWVNIPTTHSYGITYFDGSNSGAISTDATSPYTILTSNPSFDQINNADRIGVTAIDSILAAIGDYVYAPVPAQIIPTVTALSFDYNDDGSTEVSFTTSLAGDYTISYDIVTGESDIPSVPVTVATSQINSPVTTTLHTLPGYAGTVAILFDSTERASDTVQVPPAAPVLREGTVTTTSIQLVWDAPRGATSYVITVDGIAQSPVAITTFTHTGLTPETEHTYTVTSTDGTTTSAASNALTISTTAATVTPAVNSLSFGYNQAGHTIVSFIALKEGTFTISYETATDETAVDAVTVDVINSQINTTVTATLLTGLGYVGEAVASFGGAEQTRKTIAVPPAPPTLVAVTVTDTTIDLSWDEPRSATSYQIFVNGSPLSSISGTVYFHAGLTPGTEYTYTIESSYDGLTSTRSAELPVTTLVTPTVTAVRTADNSVELSWQGVENESAFGLYAILLVENGATKTFTFTNENPYTISPDDGTAFTRVYNAERIGVGGIDSGSAPINELFTSIPDLTPGVPALSRGAVTANTVTLSWSATLGAVSYELFRDGTSVGTTAELTLTDTGLAAGTHYSYTIRSIDDSSLFSEQSTPLRATTTDGPVTPVTPTVTTPSFTYNTSGNTLVSFIPSTAGSYTISYTIADNNDESTVASVDINALQANSIVAVTLLTSHGYAGTVAVSIGDTEYASNTIAVPPAPPTLVEEDTTATSITLSWNKPRGAVSYELFRGSTSVDTTTELTLTDTGLAPETAYSYTITSTDGTTASAPSTALTASTAPPPVSSFSFTYNDAGRTVVSFTPLEAGSYTINYDPAPSESRVASASFVFSTGQLGGPASAILLTSPGYVGTIDVSFDGVKYESDTIAVPPVPPTLAVGAITDTSIQLTWTAPRSATEYLIYQGSTLVATVFGTSYNHIGLTSNTDYTYTAESRYDTATSVRSEELAVSTLETPVTSDKITDVTHEVLPNGSTNIEFTPTVAATFVITYSDQTVTVEITSVDLETIVNIKTVFGFKGDVVISIGDEVVGQLSIQVPPAPPTLHVGVITDTTVTLSWTAPLGAVSYELFRDGNSVETTTALTFTDTDLTPKTDYTYTITSHDDALQPSELSDALPVTTSVIPALNSLSFKYISSGHTVISFTPLEEGVYTLRYDPVIGEAIVQSEDIVISASQVGNTATATLLTDSGYTGKFVITFDGVEHASESIQVPIAPPVLREGTVTDTSIEITWDEQHGVTEYLIYEDGNLLDTISATTYLHTGLDPETDYTYTAESTDGTDTTIPSEELAVTTRETPVILETDPALAITRLADNSLYLKWKNIPSDTDSYNIHVTESGVTSELVFRYTTEDEYTIFGNSGLPTSRGHFEQANNAERIGVSAFNSDDVTFAPEIPAEIACEDRTPCVMAQRTNDNSVELTWENVETLTDSYSIFLVEPDSGDFSHNIIVNTTSSNYRFTPSSPSLVSPSDPLFLLIYEADLGIIGVAGVDDDDSLINQAFTDVPDLTPGIPALVEGAVTSSTVTLSWTATRGADSYELFRDGTSVGTTTSTTFTDGTGLNPETDYLYTIESLDDESLASIRSESLSVTTLSGPFTSSEPCPSPENTPCLKYFPPASSDDGVTIKLEWNDIETLVTTYAILAVIDGQLEHVTDIDSDIPHSPTGNTIDDYSREYTTSDDDKIQAIYDSLDDAQNICISGASDVDAVRITDADLVCAPQIQVSDPKDGNSDEWKTKPTFGSSWGTQTQLVEAGFVFNGIPLTITDNWHTDFNLTSSIIGENNIVHIKGHASNDFKSVTLSLGIPEIGKKYDAESHIILNLNRNYTAPSDYQVTEIIHDQKVELVNESLTGATLSKVKCTPADVVEQCIDFEISFRIMAPLTGEVLAISAMDTRHRETVTFINSGVEFVGESLLESQTHVLTQKYSNQHPAETIELTQLDRRYQMWEDQNGYLWTQNEYGSWLQITMPDVIQRDDPATSVMTRAHSDFANLVTQEQDRAALVFNSSDIQGIADEPFAHDEPIRLEKLSDPEVLEILHLQALLAEELLCDCILHED